jgi:replicative DNA helicase
MTQDIFKNPTTKSNIELYDSVSENGIIGSILIDPDIIVNSESLKPRMFYNIEQGVIYDIIYTLFNKEGVQKIDDYTIISEIEKNDDYKNQLSNYSIKGIREMIDKLKKVGTVDRNEYIRRCTSVMTMDFRRRGADKLRSLANQLEQNDKDDLNLSNLKIQDSVMKLSENYLIDSSVQLISEVIDDIWAEIQERVESGGVGLPSKFPKINEFFTYEKGELVIVGGRARIWLAIWKHMGNNRCKTEKFPMGELERKFGCKIPNTCRA